MGGMFDSKQDKVKRKQELTLKEEKAKRKSRIITTVAVVAFLLLVGAALLLNSNFLRRTLPVVTIDGISFNTAEFEYFYNTEIMALESEAREQGWDYLLPSSGRPLSSQVYNAESGETWADILTSRTLSRMRDIVGVYKAAADAGFTLPEERLDMIEQEIQMYGFYAQYGQEGSIPLDVYLQRVFGTGINEQILREILTFVYTAEEYAMYMRDSFTYTDEQLDDYYAENADTLDVYRYRALLINAGTPDEGTENYSEAYDEAISEARDRAKAYADNIASEDDFINAAFDYDELTHSDSDFTLREVQGYVLNDAGNIDYTFSSWLKDSGRTTGDVAVIDTPAGAAVLYFLSHEDNRYRTVGMRQILILRENISPYNFAGGEDDPEYIEALGYAAEEARSRALLAETLFNEEGATEQALLDLMAEHSDDTTEGGYYEDISKFQYQGAGYRAMRVVGELEEWLFEDGRAVGDSKLIESEAYGYHLLYFTGFGQLFSRAMAEDQMRTQDSTQWLDNLHYSEPVRHGAFILVNR